MTHLQRICFLQQANQINLYFIHHRLSVLWTRALCWFRRLQFPLMRPRDMICLGRLGRFLAAAASMWCNSGATLWGLVRRSWHTNHESGPAEPSPAASSPLRAFTLRFVYDAYSIEKLIYRQSCGINVKITVMERGLIKLCVTRILNVGVPKLY